MTTDERVMDLLGKVAQMQGTMDEQGKNFARIDVRLRELERNVSDLLTAVEDMESAEPDR